MRSMKKEMMTISNFKSIRYKFINKLVLQLYMDFNIYNFPITADKMINIINSLPNCKIMSYNKFMQINNCSFEDVALICESTSGCTHYSKINNRYLILYNDCPDNNNVDGRILWTIAHELGHISGNHLPLISEAQIANNSFNNLTNPVFEGEADYFAATFLSPFPAFSILNINSATDIQNAFGLSNQASIFRWKQYLNWKKNHLKTTWENDIRKIFKVQ